MVYRNGQLLINFFFHHQSIKWFETTTSLTYPLQVSLQTFHSNLLYVLQNLFAHKFFTSINSSIISCTNSVCLKMCPTNLVSSWYFLINLGFFSIFPELFHFSFFNPFNWYHNFSSICCNVTFQILPVLFFLVPLMPSFHFHKMLFSIHKFLNVLLISYLYLTLQLIFSGRQHRAIMVLISSLHHTFQITSLCT